MEKQGDLPMDFANGTLVLFGFQNVDACCAAWTASSAFKANR